MAHSPQGTRQEITTRSSGRTFETDRPTRSTTPAPSWPSRIGNAMPQPFVCFTWRSVWQTPLATSRTSTSSAPTSSKPIGSTATSSPAATSMAPRSLTRRADAGDSSAEVLPCGLLVKIEHELQRFLVDALVATVEHRHELAERDVRAVDAVAERRDALAAEEPRVRRADRERRHDLRALQDL